MGFGNVILNINSFKWFFIFLAMVFESLKEVIDAVEMYDKIVTYSSGDSRGLSKSKDINVLKEDYNKIKEFSEKYLRKFNKEIVITVNRAKLVLENTFDLVKD